MVPVTKGSIVELLAAMQARGVKMPSTDRVEVDEEGIAFGFTNGQAHWIWMMPFEDYKALRTSYGVDTVDP
jgi:hypothetical protein